MTSLNGVTASTEEQTINIQVARDAIAEQFLGENGDGADGLTAQLATLTGSLTAVNAGQDEEGGTIEEATAEAIAAAREAVEATMTEIGNLKEAEGLSDTVVDAIGILENAWDELKEVQLGTATVGNIPEDADADIANVTQEQVDTLREALSNFTAAFERANKLNSAQTADLNEVRQKLTDFVNDPEGDTTELTSDSFINKKQGIYTLFFIYLYKE